MRERSTISYAGLLQRLRDEGYLAPAESSRVERLLADPSPERIALGAHEIVRWLVRSGRLRVRHGDPRHPLAGLTVADEQRGLLFVFPGLAPEEAGVCRPPLEPSFGPPPDFSREEVWALFERLSRQALSSVDRAADLRVVVIQILDSLREFLELPTALLFSAGLSIPGGIARGPRLSAARELPPAWSYWAQRVRESRDGSAIYLHDFQALPPEQRPAPEGSALLLRLEIDGLPGEAVLAGVAGEPGWFHEGRLARLRVLAAHFRRLFAYALRLQASISIDSLTGIYNRAFFEDQLRRTLAGASRQRQGCALLIVDIDDFKSFNQRFGYDAGDEVLCQVAQGLKRALRTTDILARYGGEEFAVLLMPELAAATATQIGERLRAAIERLEVGVPTLAGTTQAVRVTVSIGGAFFPQDGLGRDALWSQANRMLLEAKAAGKNCVRCSWSRPASGDGAASSD